MSPESLAEVKGGRQELIINVCQQVKQVSITVVHGTTLGNGRRCLLEREGEAGSHKPKNCRIKCRTNSAGHCRGLDIVF